MDETDVAISRILLANSRTSYSEIGKKVGMSPQGVHRRVQALIDAGIFGSTGTFLSFKALSRMWVVIYGWSKAPSVREAVMEIGRERSVGVCFIASGNFIYVMGAIKDSAEMARLVSRVQKVAVLQDMQVGIVPTPPSVPNDALTKLDLRLIKAMQHDARRPITEVADEVGVSVKTARRHIEKMVKEGLVQFSMHWVPESQGDAIANVHLTLKEEADREKVGYALIKMLGLGAVRTYTFSNLPDQMMISLWTRNVREMNIICRGLEDEGLFVSVVPNIIRNIHYFDENRFILQEEMLRERSK